MDNLVIMLFVQLTSLLYADDPVILRSAEITGYSTLDAVYIHNGLVINPNETKIVHFIGMHLRKEIYRTAFSRGGSTIDFTNCYKYMGEEFIQHLSWAKIIENTSTAANRSASFLIAKMRSSGVFAYTV